MSFSHKGMEKNVQVHLMSFHYIHAERRTNGQPDRRTYIHSPPDKRYSPIISQTCGPNVILLNCQHLQQWARCSTPKQSVASCPHPRGGGTKPHQPLGAKGTVTIYQHSINCQHLQKQMLLCLPKRNIQKDRFYSEIVIKESHGLVGSSY